MRDREIIIVHGNTLADLRNIVNEKLRTGSFRVINVFKEQSGQYGGYVAFLGWIVE